MLSLQQAIEIKESILEYLKATFNFQDKNVHQAFYDFITHPQEGMFKGPYLSLKLPFVTASKKEEENVALDIKPNWPPYDHQVNAWQKLSTHNKKPRATIITTGTGSGKTEAFMYPVLDYCFHNQHRPGIKVIILYPMNALATDQAKRLAEAIYEDKRLKGKITAGLFIGEGKDAKKYPKSMGVDHIIENRESILSSPPDILLTNFKMLDYGLMKSNYHDLWLGNLKDSELLQFLILDELHTYDGAQGTDVANLIRRLKLKLNIPVGHLCPVGTSATIGSGEEASNLLSDYATKIFGEKITPEAIITENRVSPSDFFVADENLERFTPRPNALKDTKPLTDEGYRNYIERQINVWQLDKDKLGEDLKKLKIVKDLVSILNTGTGIHTPVEISQQLSNRNEEFKNIPQWNQEYDFSPKEALIQSLFALISEAKQGDEKRFPFLYTQTQLWIRELSGLLRVLDEQPTFTWKDHVKSTESALALPPWFCRECGASGWLGVKHDNKERFEKDINDTYSKFFANHKHIYFANTSNWFSQLDAANAGYEPTDQFQKYIYGKNLEFYNQKETGRVDITAFRKLDNKGNNDHVCPECNTKNTVSIMGTRIATLSSISVSQVLSTDLDMQLEQQRKLLAFTNSVQDAAHQAAFIEARNYRFTFRSSLQKVINQFNQPKRLVDLTEEFISYWKTNADETNKQPIDAYFYRFYPTDYLGKSSPRDYSDKGRYEKHFQKEFDIRMKWEVFTEFGYNALIGRTLEKTGSSGVFFDKKVIAQVWKKIESWLKSNELSNTITEESFSKFVSLLLHRIRTRGAISHDYLNKFRENDLKLWDLNWMRDKRHFLNRKFGTRTRIPKLITSQKENRGLLDSTYAKTTNWFHVYFKKCFPMAGSHVDFLNEFYETLTTALVELEIFDRKQAKEIFNYALNPHKLWIANKVYVVECDKCGHQVYTADESLNIKGGKCLNYRCKGSYHENNANKHAPNYYQLVYNRKRSPRIYAADHTGLLERKQRELLEEDFKTRPKFNSKNAMVATSTLEMGIDIGSLNTAFNNSVPPLSSNFLQRVGRAGRSSGSALIVNFAQKEAHDLFYFQEPMDMMAGEINTPGCYLEAKEILKRHFFAYCIDSWTSESPKNNTIPSLIRYMKLESSDMQSSDFFMNRILNFIKAGEKTLFEKFVHFYKNELDQQVFNDLKYGLNSDQFYQYHKSIFQKLKAEILSINTLKAEVLQRIKDLKLGKEDPERIDLENESKNLSGIISSIKKRNTLEHLTNVGALPNYAFPETGVTLTAKVLGNKAIGSIKPPLNKDFEIVRSANQAIKEFAPDNYFYSQGYRFLVSGINTFDWADKNNYHQKRYCSNCDHIELVEIAKKGNCPKCEHESWSASSNVHTYAKLLSVKSFNNQTDATLNDGSENRESIIYNTIRHFKFKDLSSKGAWAMKEIPFGIEFVTNVVVTDSNLGRADVVNARKVKIDEIEVPAHGFITCKYCGKSSSNIHQKDYKQHYGYCKYKDEQYKGISDDVFEEVFFFREIETEALKILLPVQEFNSDAEIKMFRAGIELGLKKYFKGNPQHINISDYREYNKRTQKFDKYLILFDSIPGGTGYLEKLYDWKEFSKLLKTAYKEIATCSCQHQGKDGCYRCIYSYSNQYYQIDLSRKRAEQRFEEIVKQCEGWELHINGLGDITNKGQIEESELEDRFVRSLRTLASNENNWKFNEVNEDGYVSYTLSFKNGENTSINYHIRPQVNLGRSEGVAYYTRTDFLIICTHAIINGKLIDDLNEIPKIAIYLDGYQYHASSDHNSFENDFKKRRAINSSNQYITWSLTWNDIERFDERFLAEKEQKNRADYLEKLLSEKGFRDTKKGLLKSVNNDRIKLHEAKNNFDRVLKFLEYPMIDKVFIKGWSLYLALFQKSIFKPSYNPTDINKAFENKNLNEQYCVEHKTLNGLIPFGGVLVNGLFELSIIINIQKNFTESQLSFINTDTIDKSEWNMFWTLYNLIQFFDLQKKSPDIEPDDIGTEGKYELDDLLSNFEEVYHSILKKLYQRGIIKSEEDETHLYCLVDEKGNGIAEANLIIAEIKTVFEPYSDEDKLTFEKLGYKIKTIEDINTFEL